MGTDEESSDDEDFPLPQFDGASDKISGKFLILALITLIFSIGSD